MKLISSKASPHARKVRVLLHEAGGGADVVEHHVATSPVDTAPDLRAANPLGKLPALVLDDGRTLYDSRVITRYLDDRLGAGLYPSGAGIWDVLTLEATADGILDAAVLMVYEGRVRPEAKRYDGWVEAQWGKVSGAVRALESRWIGHLGGPLDMGQIAVGCALGYLDFRHGGRDWRGGNPALAGWFIEFSKRAAMVATMPEG
ncbi:MAG TPA: glutathione S-transferase [Rhodobacteraceae bacterium]|jgi:glutathione S-transferase|nr:glutathione S-transferase [Paracoccaceae bacterium]